MREGERERDHLPRSADMGQRWLANVGPYQPTSRFLHFFFLVGTALCRGERGELGERELCIMAPDKPHDNVWKHLLERKGLAAATSVLEEYGLSCEADVSHLAEEDLGCGWSLLCSIVFVAWCIDQQDEAVAEQTPVPMG